MITILYRIPNKFFPTVIVKKPFHAKINYAVKAGQVEIYDVTISPKCMEYIDDVKALREEMQKDIEIIEARKAGHLDPVFAEALKPFTTHIPGC